MRMGRLIVTLLLICVGAGRAQGWRLVGLDSAQISAVYADDDTIWVEAPTVWNIDAVVQKSDVYCSTDGGKTWFAPFPFDTCQNGCYNLLGVDPKDIARAFAKDASGHGLETTNMGKTWKTIWNSGGGISSIEDSRFDGNLLLADDVSNGLYLSRDDGITWSEIDIWPNIINTGVSHKGDISKQAISPEPNCLPGETVYGILDPADTGGVYESIDYEGCGANGEGFFMSRDYGSNWSQLADSWGTPLLGDAEHPGRLYMNLSNGGLDILTSPDSGHTWEGMNFPDNVQGNWSGSVFGGTAYFVFGTGVYKSADQGTTWVKIPGSDRLPLVTTYSATYGYAAYGGVAVDTVTGKLYVGTSQGLYAYNLVTGVKQSRPLPSHFVLEQNYPNPFNPSTVISYQLPVDNQVKLKVYDVLGREVETLVNNREQAGTHSVKFDGTALPSGVYFCRLSTPNYVSTMKMTLLK